MPQGAVVNPLQQSFSMNTALLQQRAQQQQQLMQQAQYAVANGVMGGSLDSNPTTWTPEAAAQQTDRALAKLSTVNPQLAEQLAAQRTGQPPADGGGFWHDITHVLGEVFHPALSAGGKVLEVIGRTSHIVPNVFYDLADGGGFDPVTDVGGALTGDIAHNWHSVIDQFSGKQTGLFGAIVGLGLDIATDPLTWLIPAGAGAHLAESSAQAGKLAATEVLGKTLAGKTTEELTAMGLGDVAKVVAERGEEGTIQFLKDRWSVVSDAMKAEGRRVGATPVEGFSGMEERAWAGVNYTYKAGEAELERQMWEVGDRTARLVQTRTLRTAARDGLYITGEGGADSSLKLISAKDVKDFMNQAVKSGNGKAAYQEAYKLAIEKGDTAEQAAIKAKAIQNAAWKEGRAMASIAGGTRLKIAVPFTQFRYISSPFADLARFSPHALGQDAARFFSGQSGMTNMIHAISKGDAEWSMLRDWMEGGYTKLATSTDPATRAALESMKGRGANLGSMMYSASERIGGITAQMSTGAKASRMGLAAKWGHDAALQADNAKRDFIRGLMKRAGYEDSALNPEVEQHMGISLDPKKSTATPEYEWSVAKHMDYFPSGLDTTDPAAIEAWYRETHPAMVALEDRVAGVESGQATMSEVASAEEALSKHEAILADMQETAAGPEPGRAWSDKERELMDKMRQRWDSAKGEAGHWEASIGNVKYRLDEAMGIHESQVADWKAGVGQNHPVTDGEWYMSGHDAQAQRELKNRGVSENHMQHTQDGYGVVVHQGKRSADDVRVVVRGADFIELDSEGNAALQRGVAGHSPERTVNDMRKTIHEKVVEWSNTDPQGKLGDAVLDPEAMSRKEAELLSETMKADRPNAAGFYRATENSSLEMTVFDHHDVKLVGEEFPIAGADMGYYPRQINDDTTRWVNGTVPKDETQILLAEPHIKAEIARATAGMTLPEAEAKTREILIEKAKEWFGSDVGRLQKAIDSLPARLVETNMMVADVKYIDALAHDVGAQVLGKAADRIDRLGRIAPFMFGNEPRSQLFEWNVSKAWMKSLGKADRELASAVMRLKKAEKKYMDFQVKELGKVVDKQGEFALLEDEAKAGAIDVPQSDALLLQTGKGEPEVRATLDASEAALRARHDYLDAEAALHAQVVDEATAKLSTPQEIPKPAAPVEDAAAAEASIKANIQAAREAAPPTLAEKGTMGKPPLAETDIPEIVKNREAARASGDTLALKHAEQQLEAAMGDGILPGQGRAVWEGRVIEPGQEAYIKAQGAKRAQRVTIEGEGYSGRQLGGEGGGDTPGIKYTIKRKGQSDTTGFLRYDDIEAMRPPKGETFKPFGYDERQAAKAAVDQTLAGGEATASAAQLRDAYQEAIDYSYYHSHPEYSGAHKNAEKAAAYKAKADAILAKMEPQERASVEAEQAVTEAQRKLAAANEAWDSVDQFPDAAAEKRATDKITKAEKELEAAQAKAEEARAAREATTPPSVPETPGVNVTRVGAPDLPKDGPVSFDNGMGYGFAHNDERMRILPNGPDGEARWADPQGNVYADVAQTRTMQYVHPTGENIGPVSAHEANTTLAWKVEPETDPVKAKEYGPYVVKDSEGNIVGNYSSEKTANAALKVYTSEAGPALRADAERLGVARGHLAESVDHISDTTGIPARELPTGERLPGVNLDRAHEERLDFGTGGPADRAYKTEEVDYIATPDMMENGNHGNRTAPGGLHYTAEEMKAYEKAIAEKGFPKPIEVTWYGHEAPYIEPGSGHEFVWRTEDGSHSLENAHRAGLPYVPVVARDAVTGETVKLSEVMPELFRNPETMARQKIEQDIADGNVFFRAGKDGAPGSVFSREGNLVQAGGGRKVRPLADIRAEQAGIQSDLAELAKARQALDDGVAYRAPASAQEGMRKAGEHRTPMERGTFSVQTQQTRVERAVTKSAKRVEWAKHAATTGEKLRANLDAAANVANKAYAEAVGVRAEVKVALIKVETAGDLGNGLTRLRIPGLEGYAMPSYIAEEWHTVLDHKGPGALASEWRKWVLGPWKRWATYRWPGFHVRNMYGAWFNNFLGGVGVDEYQFAWRVNNFGKRDWASEAVSTKDFYNFALDKQFGEDQLGKLTYGQVKEHLSGIGIGSANTRSVLEAANTADAYQNAVSDISRGNISKGREGMRFVDGKMRDVGAATEDFHRVAAWGYGMASTGGDTFGARSFVMMRHGDYADLTNAEDHIRDLIPFYKWMRTNIPYQFRMLAENPGKVTLVSSKLKGFAYDVQGIDQRTAETQQPEWMKQTMTIPIPSWVPVIGSKGKDGVKYMMADLPYNDLYNGLGDYISAALPVGRNLIESYGFHEQAFTGKPLTGRMNKLSGAFGATWVGELLSKIPVTGVKKGADGSYYINDRMENVLTAWPIYSRFRNFIEADPDRVDARLGGVISSIAGVGVRTADATQAELDFYYNELEPLLQSYRDMGVQFPTTQDFVRGASQVSPTGLGNVNTSAAWNGQGAMAA